MAQLYYQENNTRFQTQSIPNMDRSKINIERPNYNQSKTQFWFILALALLLPLANSFVFGVFDLSQNIKKNIELRGKRKELLQDNKELLEKLKEFHSFLGMKRTIKEEIKVIEENEILLKIGA